MKPLLVSLCLLVAPPFVMFAEDKAPSATVAPSAEGVWQLSTVGTKNGATPTVKKEQLTQNFGLTFSTDAASKRVSITGKVFGHPITKSQVSAWKPGNAVSFTTTYKLDKDYPIKWSAKLSEDGRSLTDGKFDFILGGGTFTAQLK